MNIAFSTGCLYEYPLNDIFRIAKSAGFDGIELLIDRNKCNMETHQIQDLSSKYDLPILSIHSPFLACDGWGGFWDRIRRSLSLAMELPVPLMNFHPPDGVLFRHRLNIKLSENIKSYKDYIKDSGITLTIENLPAIKYISRLFFFPLLIDNTYQIAKFAMDNGIHVTFDTTHMGTSNINILEAYSVFKDRIANIHLSDYDGTSQHLLPDTGYLPLKKLLAQLKRDKYNGIITLETCPESMNAESKVKAERNAKQCLIYIKNAF